MCHTAVLFALALAVAESALPLASYMKACSRNDPNLDACALKHGNEALPHLLKGEPKYGIPALDPMEIVEIKMEDANKGSQPTSLTIAMQRIKVYGANHLKLKKVHFDLKNKKIDIAGSCPQVALLFEYAMNGKVMLLPIVGKGNGIINMTDVHGSVMVDYELIKRDDGLEYMNPGGNLKAEYQTKGVIWNFDNLFNGDKTLGDNTNKFLTDNWEVLNTELEPFLSQTLGQMINQILSAFMKVVPYNNIFPEKV